MSHAHSRTIRTLADIGKHVDWDTQGFHIAEGMLCRALKPGEARKFYKYCPSVEGLLPAWLECVDHLIRWLTACSEVNEDPQRNSKSNFPVEILRNAFPEIVDIDDETYFHAFWATYDSMNAYGFDRRKSWERNVPALLHQLGAMQGFIPYHSAVDPTKFQQGEKYRWRTGIEEHTYVKDIFNLNKDDPIPISPALRLKTDLDGTSTPSYEGLNEVKPTVNNFHC